MEKKYDLEERTLFFAINGEYTNETSALVQEATELKLILSSIIEKSK